MSKMKHKAVLTKEEGCTQLYTLYCLSDSKVGFQLYRNRGYDEIVDDSLKNDGSSARNLGSSWKMCFKLSLTPLDTFISLLLSIYYQPKCTWRIKLQYFPFSLYI